MPTTVFGLPAHVLLIHVVVVLIPLGALFTVLSAVWPAARHKLGFISPLTCLIALILVPITTNAGRYLLNHINPTGAWAARVDKHVHVAAHFGWYAVALFLVSAGVWWVGRSYEFGLFAVPSADQVTTPAGGGGTATATATRTRSQTKVLPMLASLAIAVVTIVVCGLVSWQLYRIGDAGAHAVWDGTLH